MKPACGSAAPVPSGRRRSVARHGSACMTVVHDRSTMLVAEFQATCGVSCFCVTTKPNTPAPTPAPTLAPTPAVRVALPLLRIAGVLGTATERPETLDDAGATTAGSAFRGRGRLRSRHGARDDGTTKPAVPTRHPTIRVLTAAYLIDTAVFCTDNERVTAGGDAGDAAAASRRRMTSTPLVEGRSDRTKVRPHHLILHCCPSAWRLFPVLGDRHFDCGQSKLAVHSPSFPNRFASNHMMQTFDVSCSTH